MVKMMDGGHTALLRVPTFLLLMFVAACGGVEQGEIQTGETASPIWFPPLNCNISSYAIGAPIRDLEIYGLLSTCANGSCPLATECERHNQSGIGDFDVQHGLSVPPKYINQTVSAGVRVGILVTGGDDVLCYFTDSSGVQVGTSMTLTVQQSVSRTAPAGAARFVVKPALTGSSNRQSWVHITRQ